MKRVPNVTLFRAAALAATFGSACTFVNSFDDDVKPLSDGTYAASTGSEAGVIVVRDASSTVKDSAQTDALDGGSADAADANAPDVKAPAAGAIVVGGEVRTDAGVTSVLAVLDPATGRELGARETMVVAAIRYDGLRDLWYLFESKSAEFAPGPTDAVIFHVRTLDLSTGAWTELAAIAIPPLQNYESIGVVYNRVAYVAHAGLDAGDAGPAQIVTLDTTNPAKPAVVDQQYIDRTPLGVMATRSVTGVGGVVNLVRVNTGICVGAGAAAVCPIEIVRVLIPNNGAPNVINAPFTLGTTGRNAVPGYATFTEAQRDLIAFPRVANDASTTVGLYDPRNQNVQHTALSSFYMTDSVLRRAAVSDCTQTAFIIGTNGDLDLHAVPVLVDGGGSPATAPTGHSGQSVYFEPTTRTVITPFGQGSGIDYSAFRLGGTSESPTLTKRTVDWNPPLDVRPILLGIRLPVPIVCP